MILFIILSILLYIIQFVGLCIWVGVCLVDEASAESYPTRLQALLLLIPFGSLFLLYSILHTQEKKRKK